MRSVMRSPERRTDGRTLARLADGRNAPRRPALRRRGHGCRREPWGFGAGQAECLGEAGGAGRGEAQRAGVALAGEPAELETAAADLRADVAGDVIAPLAP